MRISKEKISVRLDAQAIAPAGSIGFGKFLRSSFEAAETGNGHNSLDISRAGSWLGFGWGAGEQESRRAFDMFQRRSGNNVITY